MIKYKVSLTTDYTNKGAEVYIRGTDGNIITINQYKISKVNE